MRKDVHILIADDDVGHVSLIQRNLRRFGISNPIVHFKDGKEVLDFLFRINTRYSKGSSQKDSNSYLLLLDIRMPKINGVEVLRRIKADPELKNIPVIVLSTTDDPYDIKKCHYYGCSNYIIKPIQYDKFVEAIKTLALFLKVVEVPFIHTTLKADNLETLHQPSKIRNQPNSDA